MLWSFNFWLCAEGIKMTMLSWWLYVPWHNVRPYLEVVVGLRFRLQQACQVAKQKHGDSELPPL